jgi:hypothetical protein
LFFSTFIPSASFDENPIVVYVSHYNSLKFDDIHGIRPVRYEIFESNQRAAAGETMRVTDRDRIVVEIVPPAAERGGELADDLLADVIRKGRSLPHSLPPDGPIPGKPVCQ